MKVCQRPTDMAFRIGGEEFSILTTNESEKDAYHFSEIIRKAVENLKITNDESDISKYMTVSIGAIHKLPQLEDDLDAFRLLENNKVITSNLSNRLMDAKRMRNIIAHQYGKVDDKIVFDSITQELEKDINQFIKEVNKCLK